MSLDRLQLLRNVGQFDNVITGAQLPFSKLTLLYAENGRGKTTLASILRSAATGDPQLISDRQRLGSAHPPHVVIALQAGTAVFQNNAWTASIPEVSVFDDAFVAANVCSGIEIDPSHRQNLHELILGAQGIALNTALQTQVARIERHNQEIRAREAAIPVAVRLDLTVEAFCALPPNAQIDDAIATAQRNLAAAQSADAIRQRSTFQPITLPAFDVPSLNAILGRGLPDLEAESEAQVREHLRRLGPRGEEWVSEGMALIPDASEDSEHSSCPFCAQDLNGSTLLRHYQMYFSAAYQDLGVAIAAEIESVSQAHGGDIPAAFERAVRVAIQGQEFWRTFAEIPEVILDTAAVARDWTAARDAVIATLRAKAAAPLSAIMVPEHVRALIDAYNDRRATVNTLSHSLASTNPILAVIKEQATNANVAAALADLRLLNAVKDRYSPLIATACQAYLDEKAAKAVTEGLRAQAREALDNYRQNVFPTYETAINDYLRRFNAGFRLGSVGSINTRAGSACTYNVVINNNAVALTATAGPSFRTALSAGDRNTLALAFFFASLEQDVGLAQKVVVIDDPMTSLDEHRSLTTIQEMRRLQGRVAQVVVLSHSKPFLCSLWEGCDANERSAYLIQRDGSGSTLAAWDVRQDCVTEHDRRHERVRNYIRAGNAAAARQVATDLRPILEAFARVAYPEHFPPGTLLGHFYGLSVQRVGTRQEILSQADAQELRALLDYANRFHHDTNPAYETAVVNDQELLNNCQRALAFTARR